MSQSLLGLQGSIASRSGRVEDANCRSVAVVRISEALLAQTEMACVNVQLAAQNPCYESREASGRHLEAPVNLAGTPVDREPLASTAHLWLGRSHLLWSRSRFNAQGHAKSGYFSHTVHCAHN